MKEIIVVLESFAEYVKLVLKSVIHNILPIRCFNELILVGTDMLSSSSTLVYTDHGHANQDSSAEIEKQGFNFDRLDRSSEVVFLTHSLEGYTNMLSILPRPSLFSLFSPNA